MCIGIFIWQLNCRINSCPCQSTKNRSSEGKCLRAAKAIVTDGFRWAPEMWPVERMTIMTANPVEAARPRRVSEPSVFSFTMAVAVPANMSIRVPINSAPTFLARETGGGGNAQETGGKVPSSKAHGSTLKHLQLFRRDDLLPLPPLPGWNPPKSGPPGVPGVAGAEAADAPSSASITQI